MKAKLNAAADSTALAITQLALNDPNAPNYSAEIDKAQSFFMATIAKQSGVKIAPITVTIGPDPSNPAAVQTTIGYSASIDTTMGSLFKPTIAISGSSTAALQGNMGPGPSGSCIYVLSKTAPGALLVNSGVTINAMSCNIEVDSMTKPAAIFNSGIMLNVPSICIAGSDVIEKGGTLNGVHTNCAVQGDPFAGKLPSVMAGACTVSNVNYSGYNMLQPGTYCGDFNFNGTGTLNLQPGLYIFSNAFWKLNAGWTIQGTGVTLYFADSASYVQINSGANMSLAAPTSGPYANILMFEPTGLTGSSFSIDGSAGHAFTGLIYLPSRNVTFNAISTMTSESITMVFNELILDNLNWTLGPSQYSGAGSQNSTPLRLTQ